MTTFALPDGAPATVTAVAYFTKGLGDVVQAEIAQLSPEAEVTGRDERFLMVELPTGDLARLTESARTIDDLRLLAAGPESIGDESDFTKLCHRAAHKTHKLLGPDRLNTKPWSVTVSARNPIWRRKPRWSPNDIVSSHLNGADIDATERSHVDLRVQIDRQHAHVAVNLVDHPIGKSPDEAASPRMGALRATVAAALVRLALTDLDEAASARGIYDPFCGTGTIPAEARRLGLPIFASDIDPDAVNVTRERLAHLAPHAGGDDHAAELVYRVFVHDVLRGIPSRVNASVIVSNLPWGKQVHIERRGELFDATAQLVAHFLRDGGACALLTTNEDQLAARLRKHAGDIDISVRRIGLLGQTPGIVTAKRR